MNIMARIANAITKEVNMMAEELKCRQQELEQTKIDIEKLPYGHPEIKEQGNQKYLHLTYYDKDNEGKRVDKYIGNVIKNESLLADLEQAIAKRKSLQKKAVELEVKLKKDLKMLDKELKKVEKMLKISDEPTQQYDINSVREKIKSISENKELPFKTPITNTQNIQEIINQTSVNNNQIDDIAK